MTNQTDLRCEDLDKVGMKCDGSCQHEYLIKDMKFGKEHTLLGASGEIFHEIHGQGRVGRWKICVALTSKEVVTFLLTAVS